MQTINFGYESTSVSRQDISMFIIFSEYLIVNVGPIKVNYSFLLLDNGYTEIGGIIFLVVEISEVVDGNSLLYKKGRLKIKIFTKKLMIWIME